MKNKLRILFLGTPEFAVPAFERLINWQECSVVGLVTQPDRPAGRGKNILAPPTKILAAKHNIPIFQPVKLAKSPNIVQDMKNLEPDLLVTVAFGQILKHEVLTMAPHGVMNLHASLLPKYRGAAPINWAVIKGETTTGLTTMFSDEGIDTGKMLLSRKIAITDEMDAESLAEQMSHEGADLLVETISMLIESSLCPASQNDALATFAPRLTKEQGKIDWSKSAKDIHNLVRGLCPWPGTYCEFSGQVLKIIKSNVIHIDALSSFFKANMSNVESSGLNQVGKIIIDSNKVLVSCGNNEQELLEILELKPANKSVMKAKDWLNGLRLNSCNNLFFS